MIYWLLVLVFATDKGPQGHVFAKFMAETRCEEFAANFNRDGGRVAVCVQWRDVPK